MTDFTDGLTYCNEENCHSHFDGIGHSCLQYRHSKFWPSDEFEHLRLLLRSKVRAISNI